ncbi:lysosomal integral membrane protein II [Cavenderia fasciculata]|uniref:Lysosomal integral membrane protein II n=1 Tax=Cavenderia fasciculata TaxID=261658 RepID=F4PM42_CACFS|nr:lysosomal integral membrane protein II [Cavenderia fasciculata]EGG22745.1 lysosomal integral membrane protein II [Cavenderia fasciculata]|eukprot:XP_004360596.1 lysosomal integral membrane protein II [Cavenderia fasciculata]
MANPKGLMIAGIILAVIGIAAFIIALAALPPALLNVKKNALEKNIVVTSESSERYDSWAGQSSIENTYTQYYYAYNLTNLEEVMTNSSAIPTYTQVGPFNYRYYWDYLNVSFGDGGDTATFSQRKWYVFENETSVSDENTLITNINPTFVGLMQMTGNVVNFIVASGGPETARLLSKTNTYFNNQQFITLAIGYNSRVVYGLKLQGLLAALTAASVPDPMAYFYNAWANSTTVPTDGPAAAWANMLPFLGMTLPPTGSGLSPAQVDKLLNSANPYALTNLASLETYMQAIGGNQTAVGVLLTAAQIPPSSLNAAMAAISWYFNATIPSSIASQSAGYIMQQCGLLAPTPQPEMIGMCQFMTAIPLNGTSIDQYNMLYPDLNQNVELGLIINSTLLNLTIPQFLGLMADYGAGSFGSIAGVSALANYASGTGPNVWNNVINQNQAQTLLGYFGGLQGQTVSTLTNILYTESGLFATKTVGEWLWTCSGFNDPLLIYLNAPIAGGCAIQKNFTTALPTTVYTGQSGFEWTNWLISWHNQTEIQWASPIPVEGYTESGQFAPDHSPEELIVFEENIYRPVNLDYVEDIDVQGISCRRYYLRNDSFPANATFYSDIDGLGNITSFNGGVPTFVSLWDMWEVPQEILSQTIGQNTTYENAAVPLDLEPTSGNALYYNLKLQLNFQIPNITEWDNVGAFYPNIEGTTFLPSWKIGQTGDPSEDTIDDLKSALKQLKILKIVPVVVMAVVGGLMGVAGVFMAIRWGLRYKRDL